MTDEKEVLRNYIKNLELRVTELKRENQVLRAEKRNFLVDKLNFNTFVDDTKDLLLSFQIHTEADFLEYRTREFQDRHVEILEKLGN